MIKIELTFKSIEDCVCWVMNNPAAALGNYHPSEDVQKGIIQYFRTKKDVCDLVNYLDLRKPWIPEFYEYLKKYISSVKEHINYLYNESAVLERMIATVAWLVCEGVDIDALLCHKNITRTSIFQDYIIQHKPSKIACVPYGWLKKEYKSRFKYLYSLNKAGIV